MVTRYLGSMKAVLTCGIMLSLPAFTKADTPYPPPAQVAKDFQALLARPKVAPKPSFQVTKTDSLIIERGTIDTEATEKMPVLIYKPVIEGQSAFPVAIFLHGTGGTKDNNEIKPFLEYLAKKGIMGVAIDARFHGERIPGGAHGAQEYTEAAYQAWKSTGANQTHPFLMDTAYDLWRLVDYLSTRPDMKADRIGMAGVSMGGIETWMAASVDPRIKVAVLGISVQSFKWSLDNDQWQGRTNTIAEAHLKAAHDMGDAQVNKTNVKAVWDKILPGITGEFDCPSMLRLFAPRPLLILNNEKDPNNPLPGAKIAFDSVTRAYDLQNASPQLSIKVTSELAHVWTVEDFKATTDWLCKWLLD